MTRSEVASSHEIRGFILAHFESQLSALGFEVHHIEDDFDILSEGLIDSLGFLELVTDIEDTFGILVDLEGIPQEQLTLIGPLSRHIAALPRDGH